MNMDDLLMCISLLNVTKKLDGRVESHEIHQNNHLLNIPHYRLNNLKKIP